MLVWDPIRGNDLSTTAKMQPRWNGPYRIHCAPGELFPVALPGRTDGLIQTAYRLETHDGTVLRGSYSGDRLKHLRLLDRGRRWSVCWCRHSFS